jgi:hypothetical protein
MNLRTKLCAAAAAALICAAPALAHGWPPPVGGGTPTFIPTGGGGSTGGSAAQQPTGGDPAQPPVVTPPPAGQGTTARANNGATGSRVGSAAPSKPKGGGQPWLSRVRMPWVPVYLPAIEASGYAATAGTVADGIRLSPAQGGWARDGRPVIVFAYDATNAEHRRLLASFDTDSRLKTAAHFFNCFRVDVGAFGEKGAAKDPRLSVFTADGTLAGEIVGQRKMNGVYELVESAWKKQTSADLTNRVAKMDGLLKTKAYSEHYIPLCEAGIVCPDCGHERLDIIERIAELKARSEACDRAIEELRTVAKN